MLFIIVIISLMICVIISISFLSRDIHLLCFFHCYHVRKLSLVAFDFFHLNTPRFTLAVWGCILLPCLLSLFLFTYFFMMDSFITIIETSLGNGYFSGIFSEHSCLLAFEFAPGAYLFCLLGMRGCSLLACLAWHPALWYWVIILFMFPRQSSHWHIRKISWSQQLYSWLK